ncbi:MAG: mevalonate kinase [Desulfurococcaceae archaeon]
MICSEAPGKIILFGEHFVVKNKPAIVTAVNLYAKTIIKEYNGFKVESKQMGFTIDLDKPVPREYSHFIEIFKLISVKTSISKGFYAIIDSNIPVASGMGSSAATAVSLTHALLSYYGFKPEYSLVNEIAYRAEEIVHGKPSGVDNTVSTYGGLLFYRKNSFERISIKWPDEIVILVVDTGIKRNTGEVVRKVLELYDKYVDIYSGIYGVYEKLVFEAYKYLVHGDFHRLGELMNINQSLLESLNISNSVLENIVYAMREKGALGSKISGAGQGGIVIGLFKTSDLKNDLIHEFNSKGFKTYIVKPINTGVKNC